MILTLDQQRALQDFKSFLSSEESVFILRGAAGTGKTTILKEFISLLKTDKIQFGIMAPTGRAALISRDRTGCDAATIHRSIYLLTGIPKKLDDRYIFKLKYNGDATNMVYFVDEASMVSDQFSDNELFTFGSGRLLNDLFTYCNIAMTDRKIVFIGDHAQLPPVGQSFSPALTDSYLREEYGVNVLSTTLTEVVRQSSVSVINHNAQLLRGAIECDNYSKFAITDGADVSELEIADFVPRYKNLARCSSVDDCIVITYSNRGALDYNRVIRECRYGQANLPLRASDLLLITRNNYSKEVELFNGTIVTAISVDSVVETQIAFVGKEQIRLNFRRVVISVEGCSVSALILDDFLTTNEGSLSPRTQQALWANFEQRMRDEGITCNNDEFALRVRKDEYLNALQCKYGYAITCHKAQGGEWRNVFVDMNRAGGKVCEDYFRWAYTAITRAKEHLWHISAPEFNAFDGIETLPITRCGDKHISYYYPSDMDFKDLLYDSVKVACDNQSIEVSENRNVAYQHRFTFCRDGRSCTVSAWYGKKGYNGRIDILSSNDDSLSAFALNCCKYKPKDIPCDVKFDAQGELYDMLCELAKDTTTMQMINIVQNQWCDSYYFITSNGVCSIEFWYNSKSQFTTIKPICSCAADDELLLDFINSIIDK